jgi:SAM-dependent methyltransferase
MDSKEYFELKNQIVQAPSGLGARVRSSLLESFPELMIPELKLLKRLPRESSVLELGCGDGACLNALEKMGFKQVLGVEVARNYQSLSNKIIFEDLRAYMARAKDNGLDAILMLDVLEHFEINAAISLLRDIHRTLKPGGLIVVRVPNVANATGFFNQIGDLSHRTGFNEIALKNVLELTGFTQIQVRSSEKWIKLFLDPRRWLGGVMYLGALPFKHLWSLAFGGPTIFTLNIAGIAKKAVD